MANTTNSGDLKKAIDATTRAFLQSYEECTAQDDPSLNHRTLTPDCTCILRLESFFNVRGFGSVLSNEDYEAVLTKDLDTSGMEHLAISNVVIDAQARKSAATTVWGMVFKDGAVATMEIASFFEFNEGVWDHEDC